MEKKIGFTIGKFAPLHKGHQYLIEVGLKEMEHFIVVVYDTSLTKVPTEVRANWVKKLYPEAEVIIAKNPPDKYGLDEESVNVQMTYLSNIIKNKNVTHFYSSEPYGKYVAEYLNIVDRRIENKIKNISATDIRKNLINYKEYLNEEIYEQYKMYYKD